MQTPGSFIVLVSLLIKLTLVNCNYSPEDKWPELGSFNQILGGFGALLTAEKAANLTQVNYTEKLLKMAVFVGYDAYYSLMVNKLNFTSDEQVAQFVAAYVHQIGSVFRHSSLGGTLFIDLVHLDIHKSSDTLPTWNGEREKLLNSFCDFQKLIKDPWWDLALYLTSLNLYSVTESGAKDYDALGIAPIGGICQKSNGCVVVELGPVSEIPDVPVDKIYPSGGFASAWIAVHEMAHNLGILHDGDVNRCPKNFFLMSGSRGHIGKNTWSPCSAAHFSLLNAPCLEVERKEKSSFYTQTRKTMNVNVNSLPGALYTADDQCRLFFADFNARPVNVTSEICSRTLYCSHKSATGVTETIPTSPALEGTACAPDSICLNAICTKIPFD